MHFSLDLLLSFFSYTYPKAVYTFHGKKKEAEGICLFPEDYTACTTSFLYIADDSFPYDPEALPDHIMFLQVSVPSLAESLNCLQYLWSRLTDWKIRLDQAVLQDADLQALTDIASSLLHEPLLIYDPALKVLAHSSVLPELFSDPIYEKAIQEGYLDTETFRFLEQNGILAESTAQEFYVSQPDEYQQHYFFMKSITLKEQLCAYCVMLYTEEQPETGARELFLMFCRAVTESFSRLSTLNRRNRGAVDYLLMDILENPDMSAEQIRERLAYHSFPYEADFVLLHLPLDEKQAAVPGYLVEFLRINMPDSQVFVWQQAILILYRLPELLHTSYRRHLESVLDPLLQNIPYRQNHLLVSRPFSSMSCFTAAYEQTRQLSLLPASEGHPFLYYEDHWVRILFLNESKEDLLYNCCDPWLLTLLHEKTAKSALALQILYYYLYYDRKVTLVAEHLHMHRNNVIYHIKQLEKGNNINFSDPEMRLRTRFALEALRYAGYNASNSEIF